MAYEGRDAQPPDGPVGSVADERGVPHEDLRVQRSEEELRAPELIAPTFLILLGGVTLAAAIAFGLGGRGVAQRIVEDGYQKGDEAKQQIQQQNQQEEQGQQQSDSSPSVESDGQKLEGRRLRREY